MVRSPASRRAEQNTFEMLLVNSHVLRGFPSRLDTLCDYVTDHVNELNTYLPNVYIHTTLASVSRQCRPEIQDLFSNFWIANWKTKSNVRLTVHRNSVWIRKTN